MAISGYFLYIKTSCMIRGGRVFEEIEAVTLFNLHFHLMRARMCWMQIVFTSPVILQVCPLIFLLPVYFDLGADVNESGLLLFGEGGRMGAARRKPWLSSRNRQHNRWTYCFLYVSYSLSTTIRCWIHLLSPLS